MSDSGIVEESADSGFSISLVGQSQLVEGVFSTLRLNSARSGKLFK
jgi:hypothetical protein